MGINSGVTSGVSKREKHEHISIWEVRRIFKSIGKYTVDLAVNLSTKSNKGRGRLHKTVQEEIKDHGTLKSCDESEKAAAMSRFSRERTQTKMDEIQEDMNTVKHKTGASSENMEPMSFDKMPPEHLKEKVFALPNKKRIMIRSRL